MSAIKRVVCGISGGVDSCMSAVLLKKRGFNVIGVFMRNWDIADETGHCQANKDAEDAEAICKQLAIPFHEVNFVKEYWNNVFMPLMQDYQAGLTPNPDVLCNRFIKFSSFLQYAREKHGADAIATGHYARNSFGPFLEKKKENEDAKLLCGVDANKDQTLFLSQISQEALRSTMFPVGEMMKKGVKYAAYKYGFQTLAKKKESMGICFIGKRKFGEFLKEYVPSQPGNFIDIDTGKIVGQHEGVQFYTLGQRALISGMSAPFFIAHRNPVTRDILVAKGHDNPALYCDNFLINGFHWISGVPAFSGHLECEFRFQHAHPVVQCRLSFHNSNGPSMCSIQLRNRHFAITPGQYAVFYLGEQCLGSGRIVSTPITERFADFFKLPEDARSEENEQTSVAAMG